MRLPRRPHSPSVRQLGGRAQLVRHNACGRRPAAAVQRGVRRAATSDARESAASIRPRPPPRGCKSPRDRPRAQNGAAMTQPIPEPELLDPDRINRDAREHFTTDDHRARADLLSQALEDSCAYARQLWETLDTQRAYLLQSLPPDPRTPGAHVLGASPTGPDDELGLETIGSVRSPRRPPSCAARTVTPGSGCPRHVRKRSYDAPLRRCSSWHIIPSCNTASRNRTRPTRRRRRSLHNAQEERRGKGHRRCARRRVGTTRSASAHTGDPLAGRWS